MSFAAVRLALRRPAAPRLAYAAPRARAVPRNPAFRRYNSSQSTPPPPASEPKTSSNLPIFAAIAIAVGAGGFYYYSTTDSGKEAGTAIKSGVQAGKVAANFVPTKEDYIKVRRAHSSASVGAEHSALGVQQDCGAPR